MTVTVQKDGKLVFGGVIHLDNTALATVALGSELREVEDLTAASHQRELFAARDRDPLSTTRRFEKLRERQKALLAGDQHLWRHVSNKRGDEVAEHAPCRSEAIAPAKGTPRHHLRGELAAVGWILHRAIEAGWLDAGHGAQVRDTLQGLPESMTRLFETAARLPNGACAPDRGAFTAGVASSIGQSLAESQNTVYGLMNDAPGEVNRRLAGGEMVESLDATDDNADRLFDAMAAIAEDEQVERTRQRAQRAAPAELSKRLDLMDTPDAIDWEADVEEEPDDTLTDMV